MVRAVLKDVAKTAAKAALKHAAKAALKHAAMAMTTVAAMVDASDAAGAGAVAPAKKVIAMVSEPIAVQTDLANH